MWNTLEVPSVAGRVPPCFHGSPGQAPHPQGPSRMLSLTAEKLGFSPFLRIQPFPLKPLANKKGFLHVLDFVFFLNNLPVPRTEFRIFKIKPQQSNPKTLRS